MIFDRNGKISILRVALLALGIGIVLIVGAIHFMRTGLPGSAHSMLHYSPARLFLSAINYPPRILRPFTRLTVCCRKMC